MRKNRGALTKNGRGAAGIHAGQIGGKNNAALQPMHCVISAAIPVRLVSLERTLPSQPGSKARRGRLRKIRGALTKNGRGSQRGKMPARSAGKTMRRCSPATAPKTLERPVPFE